MQSTKIGIIAFIIAICSQSMAQEYLSGYDKTNKGEIINYHSPQPDAGRALLIRSEDSTRYIEWQTVKIPSDYKEKTARFLMLAGIDVNAENPHLWYISINGTNCFTINSPIKADAKTITWPGKNGVKLDFNVQSVDRHGDFMGYLILEVPASEFKGKELTIRVTGQNAQSKTWFMVFEYKTDRKINLVAEPGIMKGEKENYQALRLDITHYDEPVNAVISIGKQKINKTLSFGFNQFYLEVPLISVPKKENVQIQVGNQLIANEFFNLKPVSPKTIYLIHHSHVDIGYTHVQKEVEDLQCGHLENAIELAKISKDFPEGARFKWNVEVMWAVDSYLNKATPEKKKAFIDAVKNGWIELDGLYANELTSLCNSRELIELTESSRRIAKECGVKTESAMISDVPGWTWGMVPVLANSGIKYLSMGTNPFDRIGDIIQKWGDKPFYWVSQSGQEKILCWIHQLGYANFHTGLGYLNLPKVLKEEKIFSYLNQSNESAYPYDILILRYNIGADNGPTDKTLAQTVKEWNEKYVSPKLVISTTTEAFKKFEEKYGKEIPAVTGDLTGYWEDGAASSASETSINRRSAARMVQAEALYALLDPKSYKKDEFKDTWQKVLLYDEHTWGSWNSISEPEADFTKQQWKVKQAFALNAAKESVQLFNHILKTREKNENLHSIEVFNTLSWKRCGLVYLSGTLNANSLQDTEGKKLPLQKLADGRMVFMAEDIPAWGSKVYYLKDEVVQDKNPVKYGDYALTSDLMNIVIDEKSGAIKKLIINGKNLVDTSKLNGLNEYFYVPGRNPENKSGIDQVKVSLKENGPVISSLLIESNAPGCKSMNREIQLIKLWGVIQIINTVDKEKVYDPEGLHFGFPFNIPNGQIHYDLAFSQPKAENNQLPGSCRNYITMENFLDISNDETGVTLVSIDAPLFEVGDIMADPKAYGWVDKLKPTQTVYSYFMNNYWETNYCAYQQGKTNFVYLIKPHGRYNPLEAEKFGIEQTQGLIPVLGSDKPFVPDFELADNGIIAIYLKPVNNGFLITLYNPSGNPETLQWTKSPKSVFESNFDGDQLKAVNDEIKIPAFGLFNLYLLDK